MKCCIHIIAVILALPAIGFSEVYVELDPIPLLLLKTVEAEKLSQLTSDTSTDFYQSYQTVLAVADAALNDQPKPLKDIIYGGLVSNDPDRINSVMHLQDMVKIYNLTWAYFVSKNHKYSTKAIAFVEAWAKKYKASGHKVNDNKILTSMIAYQLLQDQMATAQKSTIKQWIKSIGDVHKRKWKDRGGNKPAKSLKLIYFSAYLDNNQQHMAWVQEKIQVLWDRTLFKDGQTQDLKRRDAVHYHMGSVIELLQIAHIGRLAGKDHYHQKAQNGGSIAKAIEHVLPFIKEEEIHPEWVNSISAIDQRRWAAGDPYYKPGKPWDPWEAYDSLLLASIFDHTLYTLAEKLQHNKKKPLPWLAVMAKASMSVKQP